MLVVSFLLVWIGWYSLGVPYPPNLAWITSSTNTAWFLAYFIGAISAFMSFLKPDKRHLRVTVSVIAALGTLRGIAYWIGGFSGPIGVHLLLALMAIGYYKARTNSRGFEQEKLPERQPGRW